MDDWSFLQRRSGFGNLLEFFVGSRDVSDDLRHGHDLVWLGLDCPQDTGGRCFDNHGDLVGHHFEERFSLLYSLSFLLVPLKKSAFFLSHAHLGHNYLCGQFALLLV